MTLIAADLVGCAAADDPALHRAPLVLGHPQTDDPAYGWVADLAADAVGNLIAGPTDVAETLHAAARAGRCRGLSASFFPPARNPAPGAWYLRHVGLLGATEPA